VTWFRVDDGFPEHPKLEALECQPRLYMAAITVWTIMGADCARRLTDGFVSEARLEKVLHRLGKTARDGASALVSCELWERVEGGWLFHDWADYQPTKADVDASRKGKTARQKRWRDAHVDASTQTSTDASRDAAPTRVSRPVPSQPVPSLGEERADARPPLALARPKPEPTRLLQELEMLVGGEFFKRGQPSQGATREQRLKACERADEAVALGHFPSPQEALAALVRVAVDEGLKAKGKFGFALVQAPFSASSSNGADVVPGITADGRTEHAW
jgi:hypothetical protein